jgi:hypothetical protein
LSRHSVLSRAIVTITSTVSVAGGVFAPGHLGELTSIVPFELVDALLEEAGAVERRLRVLPSRVGVYFLLALALFPGLGYRLVWGKLVSSLGGLALVFPTAKALGDVRRRVGVAPMKALFEVLAGPLAGPRAPGARLGRYRMVSFDGCTSIKTPDTAGNRAWLGKRRGAGYPFLELMTLVETGTRGLLGAVFGPSAEGEIAYATRLLHLLTADMLVLWDKGFDGNVFLGAVAGTEAKFCGRLTSTRRPPVCAWLDDGSFLSVLGGLPVRIIEAGITVTCADGTVFTGFYRLATNLLDHRRYPGTALIRVYHQRWEHESAYFALRHTMMAGRVLRSKDPVGLAQEMWSVLAAYQVLRTAMVDAVATVVGIDADRAGFTIAVQGAQEQLVKAAGVVCPTIDLVGRIGARVLADLLPARRPRVSVRKVKSPLSRYNTRPPGDDRPLTSQNVIELAITVRAGPAAGPAGAPQVPYHRQAPARGTRRALIMALLESQPHPWHGREIADVLGIDNPKGLCQQMTRWEHSGLLVKTAPATYTLAP